MTESKVHGMSPAQSVATLLLSIDQELAATILRSMPDDMVDQVTRAMRELQEVAVDQRTIEEIYESTVQRLRGGGMALGDVTATMNSVLVRAFGEDKGQEVSKRANSDILAKRPFAVFEALGPEDLANLLTEEHPQIAAVFMAHLDPRKCGQVLKYLDEEVRAELVHRVATLDRTPPEVVQNVLEVMRKKVKDLGLTTLRAEPKAWIKAAARILNGMGGGDKAILERIQESDMSVAEAIRDEMFTFEDLATIDKRAMQKVLTQVDSRILALALKAASQPVEQNILGNLSRRAADMVVEERDTLGPTPLSEVLTAQQEILAMIRDMIDNGEIQVAGAGETLV